MHCQVPALRPAAPSEEKPKLAWSQALNGSTNADSEEAVLLRYPKPVSEEVFVFLEGHLTPESKEMLTQPRGSFSGEKPRSRASTK